MSPRSDVPFLDDEGNNPLRGGHGLLTNTHGKAVDTTSDCGKLKGGIPALVPKYVVTKSDMQPIDAEAVYYVLRLDNSEEDRAAMRIYADKIRHLNPKLAEEIFDLCAQFGSE